MEEDQSESVLYAAPEEASFADIRCCLVTGGAGFLGRHLVQELLDRGCEVHVFDLAPSTMEHDRLKKFQGNVCNYEDVLAAAKGCDTVFHSAAVVNILHYYDKATYEQSMSINVGGTQNVIRACKEVGAARLIQTSSMNAVFDGKPVTMYRESDGLPDKYCDLYSMTKGLSERDVIAANGVDGLLTCAIRPSGIYGEGDQLILSRMMEGLDDGLLAFLIGPTTALSENSYIDNVVEGHMRAADRLVPGSPVCGQAYFINDGKYLNNLHYFRPIMEALGYRFPTRHLPALPFHIAATLGELAHKYLKTPRPMILVMEIAKFTVNQPASIEKAQRELGYGPGVPYEEALERCLPYCRSLVADREKVDRPALFWWISILGGLTLLGMVGFHGSLWSWWTAHVPFLGQIPRILYQLGFTAAVWSHVYKGFKAVMLAERAGLQKTAMGWGWQTLLLGFASMNNLLARIERLKPAD
ncbi:MAG: NAD-dependent epimerase/dehydratase family protein [Deltaproteobacteria bacterium]|nr:NAD-dependent epimerase/dehydratase family protein [Deltaproteobacteria bacterium]